MVSKLLHIFGDSNDKQVTRLQPLVDAINELEPSYQALTDEALAQSAARLHARLADGESLDDLMPDAFAAAREAARRNVGMRHFDVQLTGGMVLHQGKVAEMKTGEGKTLVATLPLVLNALEGQGAHLITVNDYLARRDTVWMGPVYHALGFTVGCLQHEEAFVFDPDVEEGKQGKYAMLRPATRQEAYAADITYGTNSEFGFDYLRDNMVARPDQRVQGTLRFAIVDEVDNILIDEARTPLIISGPAQESTKLYQTFAQLVPRLVLTEDYHIEEKERMAVLSDKGIGKLEQFLKLDNLYATENYALTHFVENALRAHAIYQRDRDYVVQDGEVLIVDEFTGRLMQGRRFADGLHQALEAKERVQVRQENVTYATVTIQNYFRMYGKLAGMTGTAMTEAEEFHKVYKLEVVNIPTHRPLVRQDFPDYVYKTESAKFKAAADQIAEMHQQGRPVLVGTVSIDRSEQLSGMLQHRGVPHEVLNAKQHDKEATIIAQAGKPGAVTVATNMAGRGTDIVLGGDPQSAESPEQWQRDHDAVVAAGGLFVLGTERHEARRIDNQLRGRCGRQGDPGTTRFFGSLEDDIIRRFGGDRIKTVMDWIRMPEDVPLESRLVSKVMESTQAKVEAFNFDIRKRLLEYDDVVNTQRSIIYSERLKTLGEAYLRDNILQMIAKEVGSLVTGYLRGDPEDWDVAAFLAELAAILPLPPEWSSDYVLTMSPQEVEAAALAVADELYSHREQEFDAPVMRALERSLMLQVIDRLWVNHLTSMQNLREGIGLHAFGQRDPLMMYKKEGHGLFSNLLDGIQHDVAHAIYHIVPMERVAAQTAANRPTNGGPRPAAVSTRNPTTVMAQAAAGRQPVLTGVPKVGRNDPCPCGSGKKYKRCHGVNA